MSKESFFRWNAIVNLIMALSINTAATFLAGGDTLQGWVKGCACAFTINTIELAIIPVGAIGQWFSKDVCHSSDGSLLEFLSRNFIINAINVTVVSFCMAMVNVGINASTVPAWLGTYLQLHLVGLVTGLIIERPAAWLNNKIDVALEG
ncbi:MAG: hypothetical protein K6F39_01430 [Lachnospiraceae bacterium]|nr:hypothetical protein [Lachnospiraceae bacterium]